MNKTDVLQASFNAAMLKWVYPASGGAIDSVRFHGILVRPDAVSGGVILIATDGHILAAAHDVNGYASEAFSFIPSLTTMELICREMDGSDAKEELGNAIRIVGDELTLSLRWDGLIDDIHIQPGSCIYTKPFPKGEKITEQRHDLVPVGTAAFDYRLLIRLLSGLPQSAETSLARIRTPRSDEWQEKPHFVQLADLPFIGVLMPCHADDIEFNKAQTDWFCWG